jgi:TPR repeat protein
LLLKSSTKTTATKNLSTIRKVFCLVSCYLLLAACTHPQNSSLAEAIKWYTGEMGMVDDRRARQLLESAVETGEPLAMMWLARVYSTGRMTFPADKPKAVTIAESVIAEIETLAHNANTEAMFLMGTAFAEGLAKPIDHSLAVFWYRQAADKGNTLAIHNMGNVYASGTGVPQSDEQAVKWWREAATKGDAIPQLRMATMYEQGRGVKRDLEQAVGWYSQSADRGNQAAAAALVRLGISR